MGALGVSAYNGIVSPSYAVYRFRGLVEPQYFHHLFRSRQYVAEITRFSRGVWTSRLRLYPDDFLGMLVLVPPLVEQRQIAQRIDQQLAHATRESSLLKQSKSLLQEYRSALISAAVTGQLDIHKHEKTLEALA